ncbi:MAG: transcription antitermination factor NusB [Candidatus Nanopelagicales bacterium]
MTPPHQPREATARDIALEVLIAVSTENAYANLLLSQLLRRHRTDRRDSALATELVFGTLRLQGRYDAVIAACSTRPLERIDPVVRDALRLGSHQILDMATPAYAAVSATVDQVRRRRGPGAAKFANAILRAVARRSWPEWLAEIAPFPEQAVGEIVGSSLSGQAAVSSVQLEGRQSEELLPRWEVEFSHPVWIIRSLLDALDKQRARDEIEALLQRNNEPARHSGCQAHPDLRTRTHHPQPEGRPADGPPGRFGWPVTRVGSRPCAIIGPLYRMKAVS